VAARKNVSAINREFVDSADQSCLNRWLTEADWDAGKLNQARLDWLQKDPSTRYSSQGVIALDNVLIDHDGKLIEDVGWFWDHAEDRNKIAHDYRNRWRGTECFHRDGKQHLGMGDCQISNGLGQTRHQYLVFLAHSVLMRQLRQSRASAWALERLTTIGQACRAVLRETLGTTISWVLERFSVNHWSCEMIKQQLALP
jgi:hypothetical protein